MLKLKQQAKHLANELGKHGAPIWLMDQHARISMQMNCRMQNPGDYAQTKTITNILVSRLNVRTLNFMKYKVSENNPRILAPRF